MYVEECCLALLRYILPYCDIDKSGVTIDIGVGTFNFYCSLFNELGFETIAVEPIACKNLKQICRKQGIKLLQSCVTKTDGIVNIYIGTWQGQKNTNLCSTRSDWWGVTSEAKQVKSISLPTLLKYAQNKSITCIKIDVEGAEADIIEQFVDIQQTQLPVVLVFEYGGGFTKSKRKGGWSPEIYNGTLKCLEILKSLNYKEIIAIDSSENFLPQVYDLQKLSLFDDIFPEVSEYGNIIATRNHLLSQLDLYSIIASYGDDYSPSESAQVKKNIFAKILNRLQRVLST